MKILKKILERNRLLSFYFLDNGYLNLGFGFFLINILFKEVFGINRGFKGMINFTSRVTHPQKLTIFGENKKKVYFSFATSGSCYFQCNNGIEIGGGTIFAYGVRLISSNHDKNNINNQVVTRPLKIGENVWLGANVIVLPGVEIGKNSIVGAGAVVTKSFPPNSVVVGNPAKQLNN